MHAQVIRRSTTGRQREELDRIVTDHVIAAVRDAPGCAGAMSFVDRHSGDSMMVVLWTTTEQAHLPPERPGQDAVWEVDLRV